MLSQLLQIAPLAGSCRHHIHDDGTTTLKVFRGLTKSHATRYCGITIKKSELVHKGKLKNHGTHMFYEI